MFSAVVLFIYMLNCLPVPIKVIPIASQNAFGGFNALGINETSLIRFRKTLFHVKSKMLRLFPRDQEYLLASMIDCAEFFLGHNLPGHLASKIFLSQKAPKSA